MLWNLTSNRVATQDASEMARCESYSHETFLLQEKLHEAELGYFFATIAASLQRIFQTYAQCNIPLTTNCLVEQQIETLCLKIVPSLYLRSKRLRYKLHETMHSVTSLIMQPQS